MRHAENLFLIQDYLIITWMTHVTFYNLIAGKYELYLAKAKSGAILYPY